MINRVIYLGIVGWHEIPKGMTGTYANFWIFGERDALKRFRQEHRTKNITKFLKLAVKNFRVEAKVGTTNTRKRAEQLCFQTRVARFDQPTSMMCHEILAQDSSLWAASIMVMWNDVLITKKNDIRFFEGLVGIEYIDQFGIMAENDPRAPSKKRAAPVELIRDNWGFNAI